MNKKLRLQFLVALLLPFALVLGGGIWGGQTQHTHRSADQGGVISWIPTGFVGCYAGTTPPANTLEAYGQAVSRVTYQTLFSHIGTTYGAGDGVTTFNLPDLRGRMMIGMDNMGGASANRVTAAAASTLGGVGGTETMTMEHLPTTVWAYSHGGVSSQVPSPEAGAFNPGPTTPGQQGSGTKFNPPFLALKCVIGT